VPPAAAGGARHGAPHAGWLAAASGDGKRRTSPRPGLVLHVVKRYYSSSRPRSRPRWIAWLRDETPNFR
jgi:hypothetical protein